MRSRRHAAPAAVLLAGLLALAASPCEAVDEGALAAFQERLRDPDPAARVAAVEGLADGLCRGERVVGQDVANLLPLLATLLGDVEVRVRRVAADCSAAIAYVNTRKFGRRAPAATDLEGCPGWRHALRAALRDPDPRVLDSALSAYALAFPVPGDVQDELVDRYEREVQSGDRRVRSDFFFLTTKIPYALLIDNAPTPRATALLERLADDPSMCVQLAQMLRGFGRVPPTGLLPRFLEAMNREDDPNRRATYFYAVVEYRGKAQPYLDDLRRVRQREPEAVNHWNMDRSIQEVAEAR